MRLIPARAGNTLLFSKISVAAAAHPRSRGEHASCTVLLYGALGSSPLARGTLCRVFVDVFICRLIPARAGNTSALTVDLPCDTAHPRSRGEHTH